MFVDCSEICISITVKHVQHVRIIRAFVCLGGLTKFSVPGGQKILLDCGLLGGSVPRLTLCGMLVQQMVEITTLNHLPSLLDRFIASSILFNSEPTFSTPRSFCNTIFASSIFPKTSCDIYTFQSVDWKIPYQEFRIHQCFPKVRETARQLLWKCCYQQEATMLLWWNFLEIMLKNG